MVPQPILIEGARGAPQGSVGERLAHAWKLVSRYYFSSDWKLAWLLLITMIGLNGASIYVMVWENTWNRQFFDSIEHHAGGLFLGLATIYVMIAASQIGLMVVGKVVDYVLTIRWRRWLTSWYIDRWLANNRFYEIERLRLIDNPDQRIAEDVNSVTQFVRSQNGGTPIQWIIGLVSSLVSAFVFAKILLRASRPIAFSLLGRHYAVPYDLLWYAIGYVAVSSLVIYWIGKPLIKKRMQQQHFEADFRSSLIGVRRNSEQVAFAKTQPLEELKLKDAFRNITINWYQLLWRMLGLDFGTHVHQSMSELLPLFLLVPRFFGGAISFGQVMASREAFRTFVSMLSYFIQSFGDLAQISANINRVKALDDAMDFDRPVGIKYRRNVAPSNYPIQTKDLALNRPHGEPLMRVGDWSVRAGERWIIEGPSGAGKTTLLRAIAGLWPDGDGAIVMTDDGRAMLVPQRLYVPGDTLKEAVCFPDRPERHSDALVAGIIEKVRLEALIPSMHKTRVWQEELSPGEQQRLALARILLHRPGLLVLDEATSALDIDNAEYFHRLILEAMPGVTLVSVVHSDRLAGFYTHRLRVGEKVAMAERVEDVA
jgi:vitamin B12/bleomycin/antimicrobial peptide transport system ATP-binding/permease protein